MVCLCLKLQETKPAKRVLAKVLGAALVLALRVLQVQGLAEEAERGCLCLIKHDFRRSLVRLAMGNGAPLVVLGIVFDATLLRH